MHAPTSLNPEGHIHLNVHRLGSRDMVLGSLPITFALVEPAESTVAVSRKRSHTKLIGHRKCPTKMLFGLDRIARITLIHNLTKKQRGARLVPAKPT